MGHRLLALTALSSLLVYFLTGSDVNWFNTVIQSASLVCIVFCVLGPVRPYQRKLVQGGSLILAGYMLFQISSVYTHSFRDGFGLPSELRVFGWVFIGVLAAVFTIFVIAIYSLSRSSTQGHSDAAAGSTR